MFNAAKLFSTFLIGTSVFMLVSCGSDDKSSNNSFQDHQEQQQDDQGIYRAVLKPLNFSVAGDATGTVEIRVKGDDVIVESNVIGTHSGVKHLQNIMTGTACPDATSDLNNDSVVDFKETMPSAGSILIPLDSNLAEQLGGIEYGPIANSSGTFSYRRSASLTDLLSDLRAPDPDPVDVIEKLPLGDQLNLSGKVVVIHGVRNNSGLTETVSSMRDLSPEQSLPVACGKLVRISNEENETSSETEAPEEEVPSSSDTEV
ncbi:MAG: hypothetical protein ACLGHN_02325 [Bacteriovoracia bacterium]